MKKLSILFVLMGALIATVSCEKFFDVGPEFTQDAENYFLTPQDYELALIGAYDLLQTSYLTQWIGEIASDNAIAGGESVFDSQGLHEIENMTHNGNNNELRSVFQFNYSGIARVNYIMENKDNIDFEGKERILGEALFLRGYYYFELVKYFGGVPLIVDQRLGADEVTTIDRSSAAQIYDQIESDLNFAVANLDWGRFEKGRADKGAALALLGKVHLYQDEFVEAANALDQVIQSGQYALLSDYAEIWPVSNENNDETVFDIEYSGLEGGSYDCFVCLEGNASVGFHGIRQYSGPVYGDGNSYNLPTDDLYNSFATGDPRRDLTILDIDAFIAAQPNPSSITYAIGGGGHTGYYNNKYIKRQGEIGLPDNDLTSPVNYKVIRYADVLLMAAEAHNRSGNDADALPLINQVRERVGMPLLSSGGSQLTEDIWNERRYELSGEGYRFWDLVRTGKAADEISGFTPGKNEVFPIPQIEINLAGNNWSQNSNY